MLEIKNVDICGLIASATGDWQKVLEILAAVFPDNGYILIAEQESPTDDILFERRASSLTSRLPRGRAFDKKAEVRWREIENDRLCITLLTEEGEVRLPEELAGSAGRLRAREGFQKLSGKWSRSLEDWVEVSIPGVSERFKKLVPELVRQPLQMRVFNYDEGGCTMLTRFCEIVLFEKAQEQ